MKNKFNLLLLSPLLVGCNNQVVEEEKPCLAGRQANVILIVADDLGYNDLSCYRNSNLKLNEKPSTSQTPNIDKLAESGMRFTDFYCGAAVSSPSRSSILTGRNCVRLGIYNWIPGHQPIHLRAGEVTIAEMLKQKEYQTGHFGKWHLTSEGMGQPLPNDQGYDYSFYTYNNAKPSQRNPVNFFRNDTAVGELQGYSCQLVVDEALQWLEKAKENKEPFYINVWFNEPHEKVAAPEELSSRHEYKKEYYGAIENMDIAVGRLVTFLESNGLDKNTIIMFSSDNGSEEQGSNDPLRGFKCFNFDGGVRVPFIVKWPGMVPEGKVSGFPGSFTDILPTLSNIIGTALPEGRKLDGIDLSPIFLGETESVERAEPIFFYRYFHDPICMIRDGEWLLLGYDEIIPYALEYDHVGLAKLKPKEGKPKWSMWGFQPKHMEYLKTQMPKEFELYNMKSDIYQKKDVSAEHPEIVSRLKEKMLSMKAEMVKEGGDWYKE